VPAQETSRTLPVHAVPLHTAPVHVPEQDMRPANTHTQLPCPVATQQRKLPLTTTTPSNKGGPHTAT
jgi:hypothetical protein